MNEGAPAAEGSLFADGVGSGQRAKPTTSANGKHPMSSGSAPGELTTVFAHPHGMILHEEDAITAVQQLARAAHHFVPSAPGAGASLYDDAGTRITTAATDSAVGVADDLGHAMVLPRLPRDLLAHPAHEIVVEFAPPRAPSASDMLTTYASATTGPADAEGEASSVPDSDVIDRDGREAPGA